MADLSRPARRASPASRDAGVVTAELAVALPAVVLCAAAVVAVGQAGVAQLHCVDAARAGARAAARADSPSRVQQLARDAAGDRGATVAVVRSDADVTVTVRRRVHLVLPGGPTVSLSARAVSEAEPDVDSLPDRGSATVLAIAVVTVSAVLAMLLAGLASVVVARHRAASAADLAALAAAAALGRAPAAACDEAARVARRNDARLTGCVVDPAAVDVTVAVRPGGVAGRLGDTAGRARAGPAARQIAPVR